MIRDFKPRSAFVLLVVGCLAAAGCAGLKKLKPPVENIAPAREERQNGLVDNISQQRDDAHYHAAVQSWKSGDPVGCRSTLDALLARNPKHKEGRQLLADLHLDEGHPKEAQQILDELLLEFPDDASVHHSLGLLHETLNDRRVSLHHLARAVELEPQNEFYRICHETTLATSSDEAPSGG